MKKILIIEDEPEYNYRLIEKLKEKYSVEIALSYNAVKNYFEQGKRFDLIFLDIMMPPDYEIFEESKAGIETGWVIYEKLLKDKNIPIIVWTRHIVIFEKEWDGIIVKAKIRKHSDDDNQLVEIAEKYLGGRS